MQTKRVKPWETLMGKVLVKYYHKQSRLEQLRGIEVILLGDIREMEETIKCIMDTPKMTAKYGYSPGGSSDCIDPLASMIEKLESATRKAQQLLPDKYKRLISIRYRIHEIREWMAPFDIAFNRLTEEEKRILEMKYSWRRSNRSIADMFHCTEKRIRSIHYKVIKYVTICFQKQSGRKMDAHGAGFYDRIVV